MRPAAGESAGRVQPAGTAGQALEIAYLHPAHLVVAGNRCQLLHDGVEAFPSMLDAIRAARGRVRLETYIFSDDAVGQLFARELAAAAARGVDVEVLYDWFGSWHTRRSFFRAMREQGVDVRPFKPFSFGAGLGRLIRRDHRKLLIVDGEVAFVGGVNIASEWAPRGLGDGWRDDVMRIDGPAAVQLERHFCATWRMQWKVRLRRRRRRRSAFARPIRRGGVGLGVLSSRRAIHSAYLRAIFAAQRSVMIAAAYFVPDRRIVRALELAASRGVEVVLLMAGASDHPWILYASRAMYEPLLRLGVRIFEWPNGVLHAKTAVVDGTWGTVGSFNLERASLWLNHELNVVFADPDAGRRLEQTIRADCALCRPIDRLSWKRRPWWRKLLERLAFGFRRVL
ncbi:MAG: phospholipase D-like domain-containing protein [Myxococcaceae bacterium]